MSALARLLGTWFYLRLRRPKVPAPPDRWRALAIAWLLHAYAGVSGACIRRSGGVLLIAPGDLGGRTCSAARPAVKDPQIVVIDEVVGQWITLAGASALNWKSWLAAFVLFRLFDIWKPPPVRQLERMPGGAGIVLDDAMAGIYAALVLFAAGWFNLY